MSIKDQIRREIERRKGKSYYMAMMEIMNIIDSLPDEKPSEDLEEAAEEYFNKTYSHGSSDIKNDVTRDFIAGAEWLKNNKQ